MRLDPFFSRGSDPVSGNLIPDPKIEFLFSKFFREFDYRIKATLIMVGDHFLYRRKLAFSTILSDMQNTNTTFVLFLNLEKCFWSHFNTRRKRERHTNHTKILSVN